MSALLAGLAVAGPGALLALVGPPRVRAAVSGTSTALVGAAGLLAGVGALTGARTGARPVLELPGLLPLSGVVLAPDALSGVFLAVIGGVAVAAGVAATTRDAGLAARPTAALLPLFVAAMLLVPAAGSAATLLLGWELMALTSLVLLLAEHAHRPAVGAAARWYAVMTQLGFVGLAVGLLVLVAHAPADTFGALRAAGPGLDAVTTAVVLAGVGLGAGSKAGLVPVHSWLPRAHPEAPAAVSALMSSAMVALGGYVLLRVGFDLLGGGPAWFWLVLLVAGALSALYGVLQAVAAGDVKRLLGWSTVENSGLSALGIGAAGLFAGAGAAVPAGLALVAVLLHVIVHAAFKSTLFLGAGAVVHATGTRELDRLGGLGRAMPVTAGVIGVGALAAAALPPGPGFVAEWLLLQSLLHGLGADGVLGAAAVVAAVAVVALSAGLAVVAFVKLVGIGLLGGARSTAAATAHEVGPAERAGAGLAAAACVALALVPGVVAGALLPAVGLLLDGPDGAAPAPVTAGLLALRVTDVAGGFSPLLLVLAVVGAIVAVGLLVRVLVGPRRRTAPLWDCGGGAPTPRMQDTATSFAEPVARVFSGVLRPADERSPVAGRPGPAVRRRVPDVVEDRLLRPVLTAVTAWGVAGRRLADGSIQRYLSYGFAGLCAVLIVLAVIP